MVKILDNNVLRDMTAEELAQLETNKANAQAEATAQAESKEAYDTLKASAKAKLIAGEALTEEEANTIVL